MDLQLIPTVPARETEFYVCLSSIYAPNVRPSIVQLHSLLLAVSHNIVTPETLISSSGEEGPG